MHAAAGRLRRHRGQGGGGARAGAEPIQPPFYAYSGVALPPAHGHRPEGPRGPGGLPRPGRPRRTWWWRASAPGWSTGWASASPISGPSTPAIILCSTTGYGQNGPRAAWAGHDINYLAVGGYLATTEPRADGGPPVPGATIADAAGGGMQAAMAVMAALIGRGADGPGAHLDVSIADGVLWLTSLAVDEYLATGAPVGHGHNIITGRYACYDTYQAADGGWLAVGAIEPKFYANLCRLLGCEQWAAHQLDDEVQDKIRADFRAAFATRDRDAWVAELAGADTCVTPVLSVAELVDDDQFRRPPRHRRGGDRAAGRRPERSPTRFRQVGPVLAGMAGPRRAGGGRRPAPVRHRPAAGRRRTGRRRASPTCENGGWWHERHRRRRHRAA